MSSGLTFLFITEKGGAFAVDACRTNAIEASYHNFLFVPNSFYICIYWTMIPLTLELHIYMTCLLLNLRLSKTGIIPSFLGCLLHGILVSNPMYKKSKFPPVAKRTLWPGCLFSLHSHLLWIPFTLAPFHSKKPGKAITLLSCWTHLSAHLCHQEGIYWSFVPHVSLSHHQWAVSPFVFTWSVYLCTSPFQRLSPCATIHRIE